MVSFSEDRIESDHEVINSDKDLDDEVYEEINDDDFEQIEDD